MTVWHAPTTTSSHNPNLRPNPDPRNPKSRNPDSRNPDSRNPQSRNPKSRNPDSRNPNLRPNPDSRNLAPNESYPYDNGNANPKRSGCTNWNAPGVDVENSPQGWMDVP